MRTASHQTGSVVKLKGVVIYLLDLYFIHLHQYNTKNITILEEQKKNKANVIVPQLYNYLKQ